MTVVIFPRLANRDVRSKVEKRQLFSNTNQTIYAKRKDDLYVVYSYGDHFPLYVYDAIVSQWFGNDTKSTPTTQRHKTLTRPDNVEITWASTDYLCAMILAGSYANYTALRVTHVEEAA